MLTHQTSLNIFQMVKIRVCSLTIMELNIKKEGIRAAGWLIRLGLQLVFGSGHDLMVMEWSPTLGSTLGMEAA